MSASRSTSLYPASPGTLTPVVPPTAGDSVAMIWNVAATTSVATAKYPPDSLSTSADTGSATTAATIAASTMPPNGLIPCKATR